MFLNGQHDYLSYKLYKKVSHGRNIWVENCFLMRTRTGCLLKEWFFTLQKAMDNLAPEVPGVPEKTRYLSFALARPPITDKQVSRGCTSNATLTLTETVCTQPGPNSTPRKTSGMMSRRCRLGGMFDYQQGTRHENKPTGQT